MSSSVSLALSPAAVASVVGWLSVTGGSQSHPHWTLAMPLASQDSLLVKQSDTSLEITVVSQVNAHGRLIITHYNYLYTVTRGLLSRIKIAHIKILTSSLTPLKIRYRWLYSPDISCISLDCCLYCSLAMSSSLLMEASDDFRALTFRSDSCS